MGNSARGLFSAGPASPGGGIYAEGSYNDFISQNVIYNNEADRGGGIYSSSWGVIENNTVIANPTSGMVGSAVYTPSGSGLQLYNNLLIGSPSQTALYCDPASYGSQPPAVSNNDAYSSGGTGFGGT